MDLDYSWLKYSLACLFTLVAYRVIKRTQGLPLPPGPPGLPVVGNAFQISKEQPWLRFSDWAAQYGNVLYLSLFGAPLVVLNSQECIRDLLEDRSSIYSDRPKLTMLGTMAGWEETLAFAPLGEAHKESRKIVFSALSPRRLADHHHLQRRMSIYLLSSLMVSPENLRAHIRLFVARVSFEVFHGYFVKDSSDPMLDLAEKCNQHFSEGTAPGAFLVDIFPSLRYVPSWFPWAGFKAKGKAWYEITDQACNKAWNHVVDELARGVARPSFTADIITENPDLTPAETEYYKKLSFNLYVAGADTTVSAVESFFLAMILYPDVQNRAQAEIDAVIGQTELPSFAQRSKLPYLDAVLMEVLRWNPVTPLGVAHRLTKDDVYQGHRIPAGAIVVPNTWAATHDPAVYPDPLEFNPERYLSGTNSDSDQNPDPRGLAFGHGRRTCPGQKLAEDSIFIVMATTLAAYHITKMTDSTGTVIEPDARYIGILSHPVSFKCQFSPRSTEIAQLLGSSEVCEVDA